VQEKNWEANHGFCPSWGVSLKSTLSTFPLFFSFFLGTQLFKAASPRRTFRSVSQISLHRVNGAPMVPISWSMSELRGIAKVNLDNSTLRFFFLEFFEKRNYLKAASPRLTYRSVSQVSLHRVNGVPKAPNNVWAVIPG
jgi:hypothetical protein